MAPRQFHCDDRGDEELAASGRLGPSSPTASAPLEDEAHDKTPLLARPPADPRVGSTTTTEPWPTRARCEVAEQSRTFLPALQSMILTKVPWLVTLRILGGMDAGGADADGVELAAAALATTLCNVTGLSLCVGFSFALNTLAGQAKGEQASRTPGPRGGRPGGGEVPNAPVVFYLRGLVAQALVVIPVGIWWLRGIDAFLVRLGQAPDLAAHASTYLRILAPSLWAYSIQWTTTAFTHSIGMADVPAKASVVGLALHIPFNWLFCYGFGMGYLGCAYATVAFQAVQGIYILSYLFVYPHGRDRVLEATGGKAIGRTTFTIAKELRIACGSLRGFYDYLGLAIPGIVVISEWWASEYAIFLSGRLSPDPQMLLAAMTIYQSILNFCFMVPCAFSIAGNTRVANLLGAGDAPGAAHAGRVSVACIAACCGTIGTLLFALPHDLLPSLVVSAERNRAVVDQTAALVPWLAVYVFADGVQTGFNGIVKGCGRQPVVVPIVVFAYWVVGVPLAYYLGLYRSHGDDARCSHGGDGGMVLCGDVGLVAGLTVGTWCHMLLLAAVVIGTTDWKKEACKARRRAVADQAGRE